MAPLASFTLLLASLVTITTTAAALEDAGTISASYDYVIVGGGTACLTVGDRLSKDGKSEINLPCRIRDAREYGGVSNNDQINWVRDRETWTFKPWEYYNLTCAPNKELNNRQQLVPAGSVVGGSSAINGMQSVRGTREDYDRWGQLFGNNQSVWSWDGMQKYFKRGLHFQEPSELAVAQMPGLRYDTKYWGNTSRYYSGWPTFQWPGIKHQFEAFARLPGVEVPEDSGAGRPGVYWWPTYMDAKHTVNRSYAYTAHWKGINRPNYDLLTWHQVYQIELKSSFSTTTTTTTIGGWGKRFGVLFSFFDSFRTFF